MRIHAAAMILGLMAGPQFVAAAAIDIEVVHPTQYTDGTPLPATELAATRIQIGSCADDTATSPVWGAVLEERIIPAAQTVTTFDLLMDGTKFCFRGYTRLQSGAESISSIVVAKSTPVPEPKRPRRPTIK